MPAVIAILYLFVETAAFVGVSLWLGLGWASGLLLITFFGGLLLAAVEMRRISRTAAVDEVSGRAQPGRTLGNLGLTAAGAVLVAIPGFVSSIIGLLLIIPPTRSMVRGLLAQRLRTFVENLGVRGFEAANSYRTQASYGSFGGGPHAGPPVVIDEEEIQEWSSHVTPEDFGRPDSGNLGKQDPEK
ncbi:FxsA family protein [Corynebacterium pacaense]|uniref:FxsA family protein n=1 Tax=Corynebacterium pacaense TaxID=1816684 RepID=UPI0009BA1AEA|nr:FxsA family protein [Corynebacterium pacaense]